MVCVEDKLLKNQIVGIGFLQGLNVYRELQTHFHLVCNASSVIKSDLWLSTFA